MLKTLIFQCFIAIAHKFDNFTNNSKRLWDLVSICGALIRPSTSVRDLGVLLESDLSMRRHVAWTVGCCFRQLSLIRSCIKSLPLGAAKAAVAAFVTARVDRYNILLAGWMDSSRCLMLQRGSSATGGSMTTSRLFFVMFSNGCQSHSASSRSCLLVFQLLHGAAPEYLRDCCPATHSSASGVKV